MKTHALVAGLLACALTPSACAQDFLGQHRLTGQDSDGRATEVTLTVERTPAGTLRVTREGQWTQAQEAFRWTSETASVAGSTLFVRYEVPATVVGASGALSGASGQTNVFLAMVTRPASGPVRETITNATRFAPDTWFTIRTQALPSAPPGLPADLLPLVQRFRDMVEDTSGGEITFEQDVVRLDVDTWEATAAILQREAEALQGTEMVLHTFQVEDLAPYQYQGQVLDRIVDEVRSGYFTSHFKAYATGAQTLEHGKQLTRQLLAELGGPDGLNAYMVVVEGEDWGDYKDVRLYVQSRDDPQVYLRYFFDIVHEI